MAFEFITNDAFRDAAELRVTDLSDTKLDNDNTKAIMGGGHRHLSHDSSTTTDRRYVYINKDGTLAADRVIVVRADKVAFADMEFYYWDTYTAAKTKFLDAGASPTLTGLNSNDYYGSFTALSGKEALGMDLVGTGDKSINAVYFGTALAMDNFRLDRPIVIEPVDNDTDYRHGQYFYKCHEKATIAFDAVTDAELESFANLYALKDMPIFIYDSSAEYLSEKLWHAIVIEYTADKIFDNHYQLEVIAVRLKEYPDYA